MNGASTDRWPEAATFASRLVADAGGAVRAVLMYGSRLHQSNPDAHSALDFIVVVTDYRAFYRGLADADVLHRPVGLMSRMAGVLPPNVIAYAPDEGRGGIAKCLVVDAAHLDRALGPEPPDHFLLARMIQRLGVVWSRGAEDEEWIADRISAAHGRVLDWMAPYLEGPFDAEGLGRRIMEVCYRSELRPESKGRADRVFEAQARHFSAVLGPVLESAEARGAVQRSDGGYDLASPPAPAQVRRWRRHFRRSKARTTLRWLKHMVTFANWLPYVVRKVERHTGRTIELTFLERKLPIVFLWPRAIRVLLTRPREERDA